MELRKLKKELVNKKRLIRCAKEFGLVGDLNRLKICYLLCRCPELTVSQIAVACDMSISAVSHALKKLKSINLVQSRREFRTVFYRLTGNQFSKVIKRRFMI